MKEYARVLIVDEHPTLRELLQPRCTEHPVHAIFAEDGLSAQAWIAADDGFDIVLVKELLPDGVTGRELAHMVAKNIPEARVILASERQRPQSSDLPPNTVIMSNAQINNKAISALCNQEAGLRKRMP